MSDNTKILNLDEITPPLEVVVKLNGKEHKLKTFTVEDFVENTKLAQSVTGTELTVEEEVNIVIKMLIRAFPTMSESDLRSMSLDKLSAILEFARENNGQAGPAQEGDTDPNRTAGS